MYKQILKFSKEAKDYIMPEAIEKIINLNNSTEKWQDIFEFDKHEISICKHNIRSKRYSTIRKYSVMSKLIRNDNYYITDSIGNYASVINLLCEKCIKLDDYYDCYLVVNNAFWTKKGRAHRLDGPATVINNGYKVWKKWNVNGKSIDARKYPVFENGKKANRVLLNRLALFKVMNFDRDYFEYLNKMRKEE